MPKGGGPPTPRLPQGGVHTDKCWLRAEGPAPDRQDRGKEITARRLGAMTRSNDETLKKTLALLGADREHWVNGDRVLSQVVDEKLVGNQLWQLRQYTSRLYDYGSRVELAVLGADGQFKRFEEADAPPYYSCPPEFFRQVEAESPRIAAWRDRCREFGRQRRLAREAPVTPPLLAFCALSM
jgi:hypothetical protein